MSFTEAELASRFVSLGRALCRGTALPDQLTLWLAALGKDDLEQAARALTAQLERASDAEDLERTARGLTGLVRGVVARGFALGDVEGLSALRTELVRRTRELRDRGTDKRGRTDAELAAIPASLEAALDALPSVEVLGAYVETGAYAGWVEASAERSEDFREELEQGIAAAFELGAHVSLSARKLVHGSELEPLEIVAERDVPLGHLAPLDATLRISRTPDLAIEIQRGDDPIEATIDGVPVALDESGAGRATLSGDTPCVVVVRSGEKRVFARLLVRLSARSLE